MNDVQSHESSPRPPARVRSGSATRRKYKNLTIRLSPEDRAEIEAEAERIGLTLGSYGRARLVPKTRIRATRRPTVEVAVLAQLMGQVGKVGGNLHQLVKRINFGEAVGRQEIDAAIADWRAIAAAIQRVLGKGRSDDH